MVVPVSAEPLKAQCMIFVMLSVLLLPLSSAASRSGVDGVVGATVSMVTESGPESADMFPGECQSVGGRMVEPFVESMEVVCTGASGAPVPVADRRCAASEQRDHGDRLRRSR